jgi:transglutaminase-like putative cysteine protease
MDNYLKSTECLDFETAAFQQFLSEIDLSSNSTENAIALYNSVRDAFLYDPYHLDLRPQALKASTIIGKRRAWCVEKSIVLAAALRANGIPSRLGYGIVVNHVGVEKLTHYLRRKEIVFHGYVEAYLEGKWVKCTPAFDQTVCRISRVPVLNWDGKTDSLFQAYTANGKFMEYVHFYGEFDDVPVDLMHVEMKKYYPHLFDVVHVSKDFSFKHL